MSHEPDFHPLDTASTTDFLTTLRHELITPINIVVGYSSLLLEEFKESNLEADVQLRNGLKRVHADGQHLYSLIKRILPADQPLTTIDQHELGHRLQSELLLPLNTLIDYCQQLLSQSTFELASDLDKIRNAAQSLVRLIDQVAGQ